MVAQDDQLPARYVLGVDVGQRQDPTSLALVHRVARPDADAAGHEPDPDPAIAPLSPPTPPAGVPIDLHVKLMAQAPLETSYPRIIDRIGELLSRRPLAGQTDLIVDACGVGAPLVDQMRREGLDPIAVLASAGSQVTGGRRRMNVPKTTLVSTLELVMQQGRLKIARGLPHLDTLLQEIQNFRVRVTPSGNEIYDHRPGTHDDLLVALALSTWWAERISRRPSAGGTVTARTISAPRRPHPERAWIEEAKREFLMDRGPAERRRSFFVDW